MNPDLARVLDEIGDLIRDVQAVLNLAELDAILIAANRELVTQ